MSIRVPCNTEPAGPYLLAAVACGLLAWGCFSLGVWAGDAETLHKACEGAVPLNGGAYLTLVAFTFGFFFAAYAGFALDQIGTGLLFLGIFPFIAFLLFLFGLLMCLLCLF